MPTDPESDDEPSGFGVPLPPEDRLWRHPSELGPHGPGAPSQGIEPLEDAWPPLPLRALRVDSPPLSGSRRGAMATVVVVSCLAGAVVAFGVTMVARPRTIIERPVAQITTPPTRASVAFGRTVPAQDVAGKVGPSMARLDVHRGSAWITGAGVLIDERGTLLTSADLLTGAGAAIVTFDDGQAHPATIVGIDALTGLGVVRSTAQGRHPITFAAGRAQVGQAVALVGGPTASAIRTGRSTVSTAIVRASGRRVVQPGHVLHDMFEIDRDVLPDSIGGVVADWQGNVLGIAVTDGHGDGVGYVVPGDVAQQVARSLAAEGTVHRSQLGVQANDLDPPEAARLKIAGGARLTQVTAGGPADRSGLEVGDVIVEIDDHPIGSSSDIVVALRELPAGHVARVTAWRSDRKIQLSAELGGS
ncbi:MAG: serine protease [Acidimicrobiales bacterium]|nr:serine protease [Acidimicrobiales bacterium]